MLGVPFDEWESFPFPFSLHCFGGRETPIIGIGNQEGYSGDNTIIQVHLQQY